MRVILRWRLHPVPQLVSNHIKLKASNLSINNYKKLTGLNFSIASLAATATIFIKYASPDSFDWIAYLVHGTTFMFSFGMVGLLATDLAFTLKHRKDQDVED